MSASPYDSLYKKSYNGLELDLREELSRTLNGATDEIAKGRTGLLRIMRRDSINEPVRCPCRDKQTDEASTFSYCRYCLGHGFLWDEEKMLYYKNEDSFSKEKGYLFYVQYDKDITDIDYIVTVKTDKEGQPIYPVERETKFKILEAHKYKADRGRLEFWQVQAVEERDWSVHYGVKNRQCYQNS